MNEEQRKIDLVKKLLDSGLTRIFDAFEEVLFNPHIVPGRFYDVHPSHVMVGVGEPGTMGWEGYACNKCWAREGTIEANVRCKI